MVRARRARPVATPDELDDCNLLAAALEGWFATSGRWFPWRDWRDEYRVTVCELLLQRTRADTVASFATAFFARYPTWAKLARAPHGELVSALKPIGLQHRRAAALKSLASHVVATGLPCSPDAPGVGQYISRAVAVALDGERAAMVDSNWVRVLRRVFGGEWMADYRYDPRMQALGKAIVDAAMDARRVNWAVLDLGATVCLPARPRCSACPLRPTCQYARGLADLDSQHPPSASDGGGHGARRGT